MVRNSVQPRVWFNFVAGKATRTSHATHCCIFGKNSCVYVYPCPEQNGAGFALRENDYVIGDRKFGGNAQGTGMTCVLLSHSRVIMCFTGISRERFVHHTSFLWDFCDERMSLLSLPSNMPSYRQSRKHSDFLCKLKDVASSQGD